MRTIEYDIKKFNINLIQMLDRSLPAQPPNPPKRRPGGRGGL